MGLCDVKVCVCDALTKLTRWGKSILKEAFCGLLDGLRDSQTAHRSKANDLMIVMLRNRDLTKIPAI